MPDVNPKRKVYNPDSLARIIMIGNGRLSSCEPRDSTNLDGTELLVHIKVGRCFPDRLVAASNLLR